MKTTSEIDRQAKNLMLMTRVQQDLFEDNMMFVVINEYEQAIATFPTFIEAYRYRLMYIICKLEG